MFDVEWFYETPQAKIEYRINAEAKEEMIVVAQRNVTLLKIMVEIEYLTLDFQLKADKEFNRMRTPIPPFREITKKYPCRLRFRRRRCYGNFLILLDHIDRQELIDEMTKVFYKIRESLIQEVNEFQKNYSAIKLFVIFNYKNIQQLFKIERIPVAVSRENFDELHFILIYAKKFLARAARLDIQIAKALNRLHDLFLSVSYLRRSSQRKVELFKKRLQKLEMLRFPQPVQDILAPVIKVDRIFESIEIITMPYIRRNDYFTKIMIQYKTVSRSYLVGIMIYNKSFKFKEINQSNQKKDADTKEIVKEMQIKDGSEDKEQGSCEQNSATSSNSNVTHQSNERKNNLELNDDPLDSK